jgi:hypothetical protein
MYSILAADTFQIQYDVAMWLIGGLLGICATLLGLVWILFNRLIDSKTKEIMKAVESVQSNLDDEKSARIDENKTAILRSGEESRRCADSFAKLTEKINDEAKNRSEKTEALRTLIFADIEKCKERINDIDVSVASFGGTYITRQEVNDRLTQRD